MRAFPLLLLSLVMTSRGEAQTSSQAVQDSSRFRPLELPAPNAFRSAAGRPGPQYWQQRVDYRIEATLDTDRNILRGQETIRYQNNSPDSLSYLWMHLDQNICAPNSITQTLNQPPLVFQGSVFDFSCRGFPGGVRLESVRSNGVDLRHEVYGTTMRVNLPRAVQPRSEVALEIWWSFPVPEYGAARMGRDGPHYQIAWWYPRMAVYDDVKGWNHEPYIGANEFYLEYGSFDVAITLPARFLVFATGTVQNPEQVWTAAQRERLTRARTSAQPVAIVTAAEAGTLASRPRPSGTLTWRIRADSVRDFAFAAVSNVRWDAVGYDSILVQTVYRPSADKWPEAIHMARQSIRHFSEQWFRYPYPHATTIEGRIEGMEYPMLTFVPNAPTREDTYWVLAHEFGHMWFPMIVGSNERLYPWMDEGFNTFIDIEAIQQYFVGQAFADTVAGIPLRLYPQNSMPGQEQPLMTRPVEVHNLFWNAYRKPSLMLHLLRYEVLGKGRFDVAFRDYIRTWAFKHPTPADFMRRMRDASGMELDWFWRNWLFETARLDQAVESIAAREGGGSNVVLENRGTMLMPVELKLTFADGSTETVTLPVDMWNLGPRFIYRVPGARNVTQAELDPRIVLPDVNRENNRMSR